MKNLYNLNGKVALVTGSSSGMGKAIAEALGVHGATVIVSSNDTEGCIKVANDFENNGIDAISIPCDISKESEIDTLVNNSIKKAGKIDILVSCVGIAKPGTFEDISSAEFERIMNFNVRSGIYLTQKVLPQMIKRKDGVLIYLSSISSVRGNKHIGLYGISKASLVQLAKNLAVEYGPDNIRANAISPGLIDTPFSESLMQQEEFMKKRLGQTPLRRVGKPEEIAGVAVMLASKAGAFVTGQNIIVDGGTTISDGN